MLIAYRVLFDHFATPERLDRLAAFLERHRPAVDEISLFTEAAHGYHPIEVLERRLPMLERALRRLQALGWRAGVNVLNTVGHLDECPARFGRVPATGGHPQSTGEGGALPALQH